MTVRPARAPIHLALALGVLAVAVTLILLALNTGGRTTLRGTFTDLGAAPSTHRTCAFWEASGHTITVRADGILVGDAHLHWAGTPHATPQTAVTATLGSPELACTATWDISVPPARDAYTITVSGLTGTIAIQPGHASQTINLTAGP